MSILSKAQAIQVGIESLELRTDLPPRTKQEAINILKKLSQKDWYNDWDKESIIAALQNYKERNGRAPTVTNLTEAGMPKAATIQSHFHISPSLLLKRLFPENRNFNNRQYYNQYGFETEDEWIECFVEQFNKHSNEGINCRKYNKLRDKGTPTWEMIARHCGVTLWTELMKKADVEYDKKIPMTAKNVYIKNATSPTIERLEEINRQRKLLNSELYDILNLKK